MQDYWSVVDRELRKYVEERGVASRVFDKPTLMSVYKLSCKKELDNIVSIVSTGKEANVYYSTRGGQEVAVKIYCVDVRDFSKRAKYIEGDIRFSIGGGRRKMIYEWAQKEYRNLSRVYGKVECPEPVAVLNNVLVMGFIGENGEPAPRLKDCPPENPKKCFRSVVKQMKTMYSLGLVHGDLSEYNILNAGKPVLIDFSQGMLVDHPIASELLMRDVKNMVNYFSGLGVEAEYSKTLSYVKDD